MCVFGGSVTSNTRLANSDNPIHPIYQKRKAMLGPGEEAFELSLGWEDDDINELNNPRGLAFSKRNSKGNTGTRQESEDDVDYCVNHTESLVTPSLWDRAYGAFRKMEPHIIEKYEEMLSKELKMASTHHCTN